MSDDTVAVGANDEQPQRSESIVQKDLPGKLLQAQRQRLNLSVEDVAHSLHLAPRQILALEADNYSALPGMAISRGFLRSYAKMLKLDPAPLLQMIANEADVRTEDTSLRRALPDKPFYVDRSLTLGAKPRARLRNGIVLLLAVLACLFFAWQKDWLPRAWMMDLTSVFSTRSMPIDKDNSQVTQGDGEQTHVAPMDTASSVLSTPATSVENSSLNVSLTPNAPRAGNSQGSAVLNGTSKQVTSAATLDSSNMLVLKMREDSWIEVRDARNKVLLSRLAKAGESESISVREPIKLKIGNAAGVDAQLRGVPVELNASAKSNVARLTVN